MTKHDNIILIKASECAFVLYRCMPVESGRGRKLRALEPGMEFSTYQSL
jgi:hypothetical protein